MATYSPSKITKDGNTYNFTDDTKIPLSGTNALSGSIVPDTDNSYDLGSSSYKLRYVYCGIAYVTNLNINSKTIDTDANNNMIFDGHIVDTIEEQGNGYIRYSNGIQICWGSIEWQSACSSPWGSLYETSPASESYAKSFVAPPVVTAIGSIDVYASIIECTIGSETSTPRFYLCRAIPVNIVSNCYLRYAAIGTWK